MLAVFTTFLLEKTRCDLLHNYNLISQRKGGEKKKEAKQNPPPHRLQTRRSALICSEMGFPLKHILCGKLCFFFFFFLPPLLFGHLVPIEPSRPGVTALFWASATLRLLDTTQFLCACVYVCFLLTPSVFNHCLIPSFLGLRGAKQWGLWGCPMASRHRPQCREEQGLRYPPRKLIQSIKNSESRAFMHVFVH